jgi:hypothetical protein
MLTVIQKNFYGKKNIVLGYFNNIKHVYDHFSNQYGAYHLEERFSHNPYEFYYRNFDYQLNGALRLISQPPVYCMVVVNENDIRYSREFLLGEFRKIRKKRTNIYFYGYKRHSRGSYFRRPHTFQERKMSVNVLKEEGEPMWRLARGYHALPTTWDDIYHKDTYNDNWKRYRKTRWK